ncbi:MAG: 50S ribosomal protein L10 [Desulfurococcaceae archaeon]
MGLAISKKGVPRWKVELVNELVFLISKYKTFLIADLTNTPAKYVQILRKKLNNIAEIRVVKPKLALIALRKSGIKIDQLEQYFTGQIMMIFTDMNPFELADMINKIVLYDYYKPGEITDKEIVIPEGNTGLPPGPVLSVFGRLKIPTKVQGNVIYVAKDTVVAKPGDIISNDLSSLLQKLGLALKEVKLKLKCAYDIVDKLVIPSEKLVFNIKEYEEEISKAFIDAVKIAVELAIPEPYILPLVIKRAHLQALALVVGTGFIAPDTIEHLIITAISKALALASAVSKHAPELGLEIKTLQPAQQDIQPEKGGEKKEEKKEEESKELSEETLAEGFAALFG